MTTLQHLRAERRDKRDRCQTVMTDGGPICGAALHYAPAICSYRCENGHQHSEHWLAANRLGPFAPPEPALIPEAPPGYFWNGECFERHSSVTDEDVRRSIADSMRRWHAAGRPGWNR